MKVLKTKISLGCFRHSKEIENHIDEEEKTFFKSFIFVIKHQTRPSQRRKASITKFTMIVLAPTSNQ